MKGLKEYVKKHGKHFTVELAVHAVKPRWKPKQIEETIKKEVWYNVTESTLGDIVFLVNHAGFYHNCIPFCSKYRCIRYALDIVGNVKCNGLAFQNWLSVQEDDMDFTEYI